MIIIIMTILSLWPLWLSCFIGYRVAKDDEKRHRLKQKRREEKFLMLKKISEK